jgi:hypothetical protein
MTGNGYQQNSSALSPWPTGLTVLGIFVGAFVWLPLAWITGTVGPSVGIAAIIMPVIVETACCLALPIQQVWVRVALAVVFSLIALTISLFALVALNCIIQRKCL